MLTVGYVSKPVKDRQQLLSPNNPAAITVLTYISVHVVKSLGQAGNLCCSRDLIHQCLFTLPTDIVILVIYLMGKSLLIHFPFGVPGKAAENGSRPWVLPCRE